MSTLMNFEDYIEVALENLKQTASYDLKTLLDITTNLFIRAIKEVAFALERDNQNSKEYVQDTLMKLNVYILENLKDELTIAKSIRGNECVH